MVKGKKRGSSISTKLDGLFREGEGLNYYDYAYLDLSLKIIRSFVSYSVFNTYPLK